jgi:Ca2+-binding RTX toxin-like protein
MAGGNEYGDDGNIAFGMPFYSNKSYYVSVRAFGNEGTYTLLVTKKISGIDNSGGAFVGDYLVGTTSSDSIYGLSGDDEIISSAGTDFIDGGAGTDVFMDIGDQRGDVSLSRCSDGFVCLTSAGAGTNFLTSIERIQLADGAFILDIDSDNANIVYRLYQAAFARTPDEGGFRYWLNIVNTKNIDSLSLANMFNNSNEFKHAYGDNLSNYNYVYSLYKNVLQREPDHGGVEYWTSLLDSHWASRDNVLLSFAQCPENVALTHANTDVGYWVV